MLLGFAVIEGSCIDMMSPFLENFQLNATMWLSLFYFHVFIITVVNGSP